MKTNLLSFGAQRPDRRAIAKYSTQISSHIDESFSNELTKIRLEGDAVAIAV